MHGTVVPRAVFRPDSGFPGNPFAAHGQSRFLYRAWRAGSVAVRYLAAVLFEGLIAILDHGPENQRRHVHVAEIPLGDGLAQVTAFLCR